MKVYGYVDSNWATNKENRKSVSGYILTLGGCLVNWVSKTQATVALSSTEAEYIAASTCATEIKFIQMLLEELTPNANMKPAVLLEDNTGCLYLIENQTVGNRTKHIDIRMHHIREMVSGEVPRMRMKFVRSELNFGDIMTKNVTEAIHNTLVPMLKDGRIADMIHETVNREDVGKLGNGQKVRPKSEVSTAREPIREVAYTLDKITKPIGVSSVGLDKSSDLNSRYFASEMTIMKTNRNKNG